MNGAELTMLESEVLAPPDMWAAEVQHFPVPPPDESVLFSGAINSGEKGVQSPWLFEVLASVIRWTKKIMPVGVVALKLL